MKSLEKKDFKFKFVNSINFKNFLLSNKKLEVEFRNVTFGKFRKIIRPANFKRCKKMCFVFLYLRTY